MSCSGSSQVLPDGPVSSESESRAGAARAQVGEARQVKQYEKPSLASEREGEHSIAELTSRSATLVAALVQISRRASPARFDCSLLPLRRRRPRSRYRATTVLHPSLLVFVFFSFLFVLQYFIDSGVPCVAADLTGRQRRLRLGFRRYAAAGAGPAAVGLQARA
jgi:hypothetical protein